MKSATDWLLEEDQPSIRYLALTQLLEKPEHDPRLKPQKNKMTERGWAADILANQDPEGYWVSKESLYKPKYLSTNWMLLILS